MVTSLMFKMTIFLIYYLFLALAFDTCLSCSLHVFYRTKNDKTWKGNHVQQQTKCLNIKKKKLSRVGLNHLFLFLYQNFCSNRVLAIRMVLRHKIVDFFAFWVTLGKVQ